MVKVENNKMIIYAPIEINFAFFMDELLDYIDTSFKGETGYELDDLSKDDFNSFIDYLIEELKNNKYR